MSKEINYWCLTQDIQKVLINTRRHIVLLSLEQILFISASALDVRRFSTHIITSSILRSFFMLLLLIWPRSKTPVMVLSLLISVILIRLLVFDVSLSVSAAYVDMGVTQVLYIFILLEAHYTFIMLNSNGTSLW